MNIKPRLLANLIAILVLGIVMVTWVVTQVIGTGIGKQPFTVTADFAASGGVFSNQEVTYRGVLIGKVGSLELNDDGVDIDLLIDPEWEGEIPSAVLATVQSKSAVGEQFVNLTPTTDAGPTLEDGDRIPREQTSLPVDFQALLRSLDLVLADVPPGTTRRLVTNLAGGVAGKGGDIATILESLGTLSDAFADVAPEQKRLLENATRVGAAFTRTKDSLSAAIRAADDVFAGIGDEPEELAALFEANDRFARAGIDLLARRGDDLAGGVRALADFVAFQLRESDSVVQSLEHVPQFLHAVEDASIPWRSPDGRSFYRIRTGLVVDNVPSTWPCKYKLPEDYERLPHVRDARTVLTKGQCLPASTTQEQAAVKSLVKALKQWAETNPEDLATTVAGELPDSTSTSTSLDFIWPVSGPITSYFGPRDGEMHTGIDIAAPAGTAVAAAAEGRVIAAEYQKGYGNTVIVVHGEGLATVYAHLSAMAVVPGDFVDQGDALGAVGCTGDCDGDHLHFEVRLDGTPVDPLHYLPGGMFTQGMGRSRP